MKVFLSVFDGQGERVAGPTAIRKLLPDEMPTHCEVRWSEAAEAFLVAWLQRPLDSRPEWDGIERLEAHIVEMR